MSAYDRIAGLYDPWSASVVEDIDFYVEEARRSGGPVLDLGVGTGRIAIPIAHAGLRRGVEGFLEEERKVSGRLSVLLKKDGNSLPNLSQIRLASASLSSLRGHTRGPREGLTLWEHHSSGWLGHRYAGRDATRERSHRQRQGQVRESSDP